MKKRILLQALIAIMLFACIAFAACGNDSETNKGPITVAQPVCAVQTLYYGDPLPTITTTITGGNIALDKNQTLIPGTKDYNWTFTPDNPSLEYENLTGTISLTVLKANQSLPAGTTLELSAVSSNQVTLVPLGVSYEYSKDSNETKTWQASNIFSGLENDTQYTFFARLKGNDNYNPSDFASLDVRTNADETAALYFLFEGNAIVGLTESGLEQTSLVIPSMHNNIAITTVEDFAFEDCALLEFVCIPQSVTSVGDNVFDGCPLLKEIFFGGNDLDGWGDKGQSQAIIYCYAETKPDEPSDSWRYVEGTPTPWYVTVVQPVYEGEALRFGDALPTLTTTTLYGTVALDAGQTLVGGTHDYNWIFTSSNTDIEFLNATGTISLTVQKGLIEVVQPVYEGETLYFGDPLPIITTTTTGGTIALDAGQTLVGGEHEYNWTFTPTENTENYDYSPLTGTITLTVTKLGQDIPPSVQLEVLNATSTQITLVSLGSEYEYSVTAGETKVWQASNIFSGLSEATKYTFFARLKDDGNHNPSEWISVTAFTGQSGPITIAQPVYSGSVLRFGGSLPNITTATPYGSVALDAGQTLVVGTTTYNWTFTPDSDNEFTYASLMGTIELTVEKGYQSIPSGATLYVDAPYTTATTVTLFITNGGSSSNYEYKVELYYTADLVFDWRDFPAGGRVDGLNPNTYYFFTARLKATASYEPSSGVIYVEERTKSESSPHFEFDGGTLVACTPLAEQQELLVIPSTFNGVEITTIGEDALCYLMILKGVVIPTSITTIEFGAFEGCYSLEKIFYYGSAAEWALIDIDPYAFDGSASDILYFYSETEPTETGNYWHMVGTIPTVYGGQEEIKTELTPSDESLFEFADYEYGVIYANDDVAYFVIPSEHEGVDITIIGSMGFAYLFNLNSIVIPNSIEVIESMAFSCCYDLAEIFYFGTAAEWASIDIESGAFDGPIDDILYFYSATEPTTAGNYWHIVGGIAVAW